MNYGIVIYVLGWILRIEGVLLLLPCVTALIYGERAGFAYVAGAAIAFVLGFALSFKKPRSTKVYAREGFVVVALAWLVMSLVGAIVGCIIGGPLTSYISQAAETPQMMFGPHSSSSRKG